MRLSPIVELLQQQIPALRHVDGVAGLSVVKERSLAPNSAYVAPLSESAEDNSRVGGATRQVITVRFAVLLILGGQARRKDAIDESLEGMTVAVKGALVGWCHPDAISATTYRSGRLLRAADSQLAWQMDFQLRQQEMTP